ncbi:MAG: GNAT family N-acetyltransferase [bacterium]
MTPAATLPVTTRRALPDEAPLLATLAAATFRDTFGGDNTPQDMAAYLAASFGDEIQRRELLDARVTTFFAEHAGEVVGYATLREGTASAGVPAEGAIEIARLYAVTTRIGSGVGAALMRRCLDEAQSRGRRVVWLCVWERNARAIAFYQRWGFADVGVTTFVLGDDRQADRVMARRVGGEGQECATR